MPDCSYCGESFENEADYLDHLETAHSNELSRIDERRVERHTGTEDSAGVGTYLSVAAGLIIAVALGYVAVAGVPSVLGGPGDSGDIETQPLPERGDDALLQNVESFPSEGRQHVSRDTQIEYQTTPPTSGPHYDGVVSAGFYEETPPMGDLVHSLEHGAVVIYYDPQALTPEARESLQAYASVHTDPFASVIVAPHPETDPESSFVLTAWRHKLTMDEYDAEVVRAFLAEYLGRGPERAVR